MIVIGDSSALICLAKVNQLELLDKLYKEVFVPQKVYDEVSRNINKDCAIILESYLSTKIWKDEIVEEIKNPSKNGKDDGEYACINLWLTIETHEEIEDAYQLLVDDRGAKKLALNEEISCIGSIGIMRMAIRKGLWNSHREITSAMDHLENEVENSNFRLPINKLREELVKAMEIKGIKEEVAQSHNRGMSLWK